MKVVLTPILRVVYRVKVDGKEHVPTRGPVILAANHRSFLDSIFLPLVIRRRVTYVAKAEYFDDAEDRVVLPVGRADPDPPRGRVGQRGRARRRDRRARVGRRLRHLPRGHAHPRRAHPPWPHRCRPPRDAHRRTGHPGRPRRHRRVPADRQEAPAPLQDGRGAVRPADRRRALRAPRRAPRAPPAHRRADVRDRAALRPLRVPGHVRDQEGRGRPGRVAHVPAFEPNVRVA